MIEEQVLEETQATQFASILDDELAMERLRSQVAAMAKPKVSRPEPELSIRECGCTKHDYWGYRVIQTQQNGKLVTPPIEILVTQSLFAKNDALEKINKVPGDFAIPDRIYACGHSHSEFAEFWDI